MNGFESDFNRRDFNTINNTTSGNRDHHHHHQRQNHQSFPSNSGNEGEESGGLPPSGIQQEFQPYGPEFPSYPPPKCPGATGGRSDLLDALWSNVNQDLLIAKTFYFFFFSAFGSLFPLMAIFFKQLGMNPFQCGLLTGFRPFVEFLSAPFWGTIADAYQKGKQILLFSLMCWIVFTLALCFISPPAASCIIFNKTHHILTEPERQTDDIYMDKRSVQLDQIISKSNYAWTSDDDEYEASGSINQGPSSSYNIQYIDDNNNSYSDNHQISSNSRLLSRQRRKTRLPPGHVIGQSPGPVHFTVNYDPSRHRDFISPVFSTIVYRKEDVRNAFFVILLLVVTGEFFSAPAITLADSVTLTYLGENANNYGKQRMFGSLGWGLSMFFVGIALDHSTVFSYHPCGPHERERNYTICFAVFSVLMGAAFLTATQLRFDYDAFDDTIPMKSMPDGSSGIGGAQKTAEDQIPPANEPPKEPKPEKSTVFASKAREIPEWWRVLRTFANLRYGSFLFVAWFMGLGVGFVFTFLFWHLQDLGGTPTLFGVASVLCLGLLGNLARFLYISWLHNPWWVLPFEFIQGVTHAAVWAACCSYITQATPMNLRSSAQGVLQGLHHGLGRGCGAVLGGLLATYSGTAVTFRTYGFICLLVLIAFIFINYYQPDTGFASAESVEPKQVLEESSHLAPHGVPSGPMPRALSSSRLEEMGNNGNGKMGNYPGYGTTNEKQNGPFLGVPNYGGGVVGRGQVESNENISRSKNFTPDGQMNLNDALRNSSFSMTSPLGKSDYDYIKDNFKAYKDALNYCNNIDDDKTFNESGSLLKAPHPHTVAHTLQPRNSNNYAW